MANFAMLAMLLHSKKGTIFAWTSSKSRTTEKEADANMNYRKMLGAALAAALALTLGVPALAAEGKSVPVTGTDPVYTLIQRGAAFPTRVWGTAVELGDRSLTLENSDERAPHQKVVVNVGEETVILDAVSGATRSFDDLRAGETLYAWVGPEMTMSLPPISTARVVLCGIPADFAVPTYAEVETITVTEKGVDAYVSNDVLLHLSADTEYLAAPGGTEKVEAADIVPGARLLAWYSVTTMSLPAQASPSKVMVFPSDYTGWVSADGLELAINGESLTLEGPSAAKVMSLPAQASPSKVMVFPSDYTGWVSADGLELAINGESLTLEGPSAAKVKEGRLLVPVRAVAEALGCEITWEPYTSQVTVSRGDTECYHFTIGADQAAMGDVTVGLVRAAEAVDGVTFLALDDLIVLHGLKLSQG